ncbi:MAG: hypothetical protein AAFX99_28985, partial [Myxococcota bacterium]
GLARADTPEISTTPSSRAANRGANRLAPIPPLDRPANTTDVMPTPLLSTAFGLQHPEAFDTLVIEPMAEEAPSRAVVFLHGYAGNFTLPCWQIAQAARLAGAVTVCPSVGLKGDWWTTQAT